MANYKLLNSAGDWRKGDVVTADDINKSNLGGTKRLLDLKAIEETDEDPGLKDRDGARGPDESKGDNVDPGSDDTVDKRADRRAEAVGRVNDGKRTLGDKPAGETADAAENVEPRSGRPGTVIRTSGNPQKAAPAKRGGTEE